MYLNELHDKIKEIFQDYYEIEVKKKDEDRIRISVKKENIEVFVLFKISNNFNLIGAKTVYNNTAIPELPCWFKNKQIELMDLITEFKKVFKVKHIKECETFPSEYDSELIDFIQNLKDRRPQLEEKDWNKIIGGKSVERIEDTQEFKDKHKHNATVEESNIKPNHYKLNIKGQEFEVMDVVDAVVEGMEAKKACRIMNILKYVCRAEKKNGLEDYKKARTYLDMLIGGKDDAR